MGRPTKYNKEIADAIIGDLATCTDSFGIICERAGICEATGMNWLNSYPDFLERYVGARGMQSEFGYDEMRDIADAPLPTSPMYHPETGEYLGEKVDAGVAMAEINKRKLQIDVIKFKLVKLQPKRFGERSSVDIDIKVRKVVSDEQMQLLRGDLIKTITAPKPDFEDAEEVD